MEVSINNRVVFFFPCCITNLFPCLTVSGKIKYTRLTGAYFGARFEFIRLDAQTLPDGREIKENQVLFVSVRALKMT